MERSRKVDLLFLVSSAADNVNVVDNGAALFVGELEGSLVRDPAMDSTTTREDP
jgi:hypothetical protein